jgi:threonine dehydrogenase-like Zn-dependent dehydrogenase
MTSDDARAFWVTAAGRGEVRAEPLPAPVDDEVVVRALYSGVSQHERMRAPFQAGAFPAPVKYGYASVGSVEQGPRGLQGRTVFVLYPHQTRYVVPASAAHAVPDEVPAARAVLAANMETAINGLWDAAPRVGDRITVIGAGTVGSLVAWLASRMPGCDVELVDTNARRSRVAEALGVRFAPPEQARADADVVVHASGSSAGLGTALRLAAFEAAIVELSWYGAQDVAVPLGEGFHARRLTLRSSQVGHVATAQRARWDTRRRMALALSLLADPALDVLITGESAFEDLPDVMPRLASDPGDTLCHRIRYS